MAVLRIGSRRPATAVQVVIATVKNRASRWPRWSDAPSRSWSVSAPDACWRGRWQSSSTGSWAVRDTSAARWPSTVAEHGDRNGYGRPRAVPIGISGRLLNGRLTIMTLLLGGRRFVDGVYVPAPDAVSAA